MLRLTTLSTMLCITVCSHAQDVKISVFRQSGISNDWDPVTGRIAYAIKEKDKYYDIHIADADGSHDTCITCDDPLLPNKHIACPIFDPSGKYILFTAEQKEHAGSSVDALPGFGAFTDIWVMTRDAKKCWKLTDTPNDKSHGILPGFFSPDGKHIAWTERIKKPKYLNAKRSFGYWVIKMADFVETPNGPALQNIRTFQPGPEGFYECYGFSRDGKRLIFCSSMNQPSVWTQQIFTIDTTGNDLKQLTTEGYNEHAVYSPKGNKIIWMSNLDNKNKGCDWWTMNADGTDKKRLTFMNDPKSPQYRGKAWAGLISFSPDGKRFIGSAQKSLITQEAEILMVELNGVKLDK